MDITFQCYKRRDGTDYVIPKGVIDKSINPYDPSTYLVHLENMDYPYIIDEWMRTREYCVKNNMIECVFPKYIAKMNLAAYKKFTWKNTEEINQIFSNSKFVYNDLEELEKGKMAIQEILDKYNKNEIYDDHTLIVPESYKHLQNQIENIKSLSKKYPINFEDLTAAAIYVLGLIEEDPSIAYKIHSIKIQERKNDN